jgi:class 3 adenylate cyclase
VEVPNMVLFSRTSESAVSPAESLDIKQIDASELIEVQGLFFRYRPTAEASAGSDAEAAATAAERFNVDFQLSIRARLHHSVVFCGLVYAFGNTIRLCLEPVSAHYSDYVTSDYSGTTDAYVHILRGVVIFLNLVLAAAPYHSAWRRTSSVHWYAFQFVVLLTSVLVVVIQLLHVNPIYGYIALNQALIYTFLPLHPFPTLAIAVFAQLLYVVVGILFIGIPDREPLIVVGLAFLQAFAHARRYLGMMRGFLEMCRIRRQRQLSDQEECQCDDLLRSMLPPSILVKLQNGESISPEQYDQVTVMFAEICEFGSVTKDISATDTVIILNEIFNELDRLTDEWGVYKVETVREVYMAVAGCPIPALNHADLAANMALDILKCLNSIMTGGRPDDDDTDMAMSAKTSRNRSKGQIATILQHLARGNRAISGETPVKIHVGLHSGPIRAGIIGIRNSRFKLFGDTVNFASRMESTCPPQHIQVSPSTFDLLEKSGEYDYECCQRDEIFVKGKGNFKPYFLTRSTKKEIPASEGTPESPTGHTLSRQMTGGSLARQLSRPLSKLPSLKDFKISGHSSGQTSLSSPRLPGSISMASSNGNNNRVGYSRSNTMHSLDSKDQDLVAFKSTVNIRPDKIMSNLKALHFRMGNNNHQSTMREANTGLQRSSSHESSSSRSKEFGHMQSLCWMSENDSNEGHSRTTVGHSDKWSSRLRCILLRTTDNRVQPRTLEVLDVDYGVYRDKQYDEWIQALRYKSTLVIYLLCLLGWMDYWTFLNAGNLTNDFKDRITSAAFRNGFLIPCVMLIIVVSPFDFFKKVGQTTVLIVFLIGGVTIMHSAFTVYEGDPAFVLVFVLIILDVQVVAFRWRLLLSILQLVGYFVTCIILELIAKQLHLLGFSIGIALAFSLAVHGQEHFDHVSNFQLRQLQQHTDHLKQMQEIQWQLLADLVPPLIAKRLLNNKGDVIADKYDDVTILFTDMKNFTMFSSKLDPADLAAFLNTMFSSFDEILERFGLHKVEIIGDAYFVVSGAPSTEVNLSRSPQEHAAFAAEAALAMISVLPQICEDPNVSIRVGLHSGSVVGGVVGRKDPRFHLFGTNVEIANTMESLSEPNRVHVTSDTHRRLQFLENNPPYNSLTFADSVIFEFEDRDNQEIPHRGPEPTYFLVRSHFQRHFRMRQRREAAAAKGELFRESRMKIAAGSLDGSESHTVSGSK